MANALTALLNGHLAKHGWSFKRLAKEAGLPPNTVYRWTRGEVRRVRHWHDLARAARALALNRAQTDALLGAGGHPSVEDLLKGVFDDDDRDLLSHWTRSSPNNLPAQLTSFVGREEELDKLHRLLSTVRLVTLTGPGGAGKTRLAIEAARMVLSDVEEVAFVDLAAVRDPDLVLPTIARTLDLKESPDEPPLVALRTYLRDREVLLVLDNFEQVVEAAPLVTELLAAAPGVKALVTSRMRLNVRGEHELAVPPLPLPAPASGFEALRHNPSVTLFADRARAHDSAFELTPNIAPLVADVCARLEGLPLGIELAAARTRQVRLGAMLERFPGRLSLVDNGPRDVPDRQRTLRATIAWSYDLLDPGTQELLDATSVFAGGFTEDAVESIRGAIGQSDIPVPAGLESLVEQNLLTRSWETDDEPRYEMLETIREYARERLGARGETGVVADAAVTYYLTLAEAAKLDGERRAYWLRRLSAEHENFRTALGRCRDQGQSGPGLRLCIALMPLWLLRDQHLDARNWMETFMAAPAAVSPGLRARGLLWQGLLLMRGTGDDASAARLFAEALVLFREAGDLDGTSETLQAEGDVYRERREWQRARQRYAESLELGLQTGNAYLVAHGYMGLALCAQEAGKFDDAQHHWQCTQEWAEKAGNEATVALALNSLGEMARYRGEWGQAERYYERTLRLAKEMGSEFRMALALHNLGYVALYRGEIGASERLFAKGLSLYQDRRYAKGVAECLAGLARVEASRARPERAARLCGATEAILDGLGTWLDTLDRADYERTLETLRTHLGDRLETFLDEGRSMSIDQAVTTAGVERATR